MKAATGIAVLLALVALAGANPRPDLRDKAREHWEALPEEVRNELLDAFENHRKPSEAFFDRVRSHLLKLLENPEIAEFAERQYERALRLLPLELRADVNAVVQGWLINGGVPQASEALRTKLADHFRQLKAVHFERFLSVLSPELREEVQAVIQQVMQGAQPQFNPELFERVREHVQQLKVTHAL
ncbi:uncharacterized protein LOC128275663 [Anopheles cruzii]|uniref:uncharacterized protein LOC128275663 n=1 Tax=Anopheles cruzii TaxID=68878 RepID=UPI0022EC2E7F|nr:uncharacterized protein LOC128275663 [Anopheles cruzii]